LVFLALLVLELFTMYATDRRTDGRTKATLNAPYPTGGGIINFNASKTASLELYFKAIRPTIQLPPS